MGVKRGAEISKLLSLRQLTTWKYCPSGCEWVTVQNLNRELRGRFCTITRYHSFTGCYDRCAVGAELRKLTKDAIWIILGLSLFFDAALADYAVSPVWRISSRTSRVTG
jgi:hypothetical protein